MQKTLHLSPNCNRQVLKYIIKEIITHKALTIRLKAINIRMDNNICGDRQMSYPTTSMIIQIVSSQNLVNSKRKRK